MFSKLGLFVLTLKLFNTVAASGRIKEVNSPKGKSRADASERRVKTKNCYSVSHRQHMKGTRLIFSA